MKTFFPQWRLLLYTGSGSLLSKPFYKKGIGLRGSGLKNEGRLFKADISPFEFDLDEMESFTFRQDDLPWELSAFKRNVYS